MTEAIFQYFSQFSPELATFILSAFPITELRLTIPVAIRVWGVNPYNAFGLAVLGNLVPFFPLYYGLDQLRKLSKKHTPWLTRIIDNAVSRAHNKVEKKYARYGALALFLFTAIPLPLTGLWTATLSAIALKVPVKYAFIGIASGVVVAGVIMTIGSLGSEVLF
ncbi:ligand-binding protein SH3 [Candidatus Uhrbacteria bacterium CG_4_9_14_3_um_filter_41_35]|uniref:Ligand-binding protein SH3 n=1 Tax=Candidatus Uhrbacteria bacterium CG_4_9_14_3_um_filter_41_35 TaxID=1975034 RepID=A0A2M7XG14_9BACT|nr:MAG: ligand-binding protein SH3 [Candidatus Uhrbacteria bacterium CG11_big_fil_rev_8_21_14_0_20_41_9]PJA46814.1 MAG: ligand-binding protein SH3 [Candidatus Uhrbacteria bacterium CG_4_9_14_3_um_filter_41_35]